MNTRNAVVSVIVPIYGTEAYLPACIESIQGQSYSDIQIVLVDDQSPDKCAEICDRYAEQDPRIVVIHQENRGVSGARNTGIRYATGDYIMFVDSDDALYNNAVSILLDDASKHSADIVSATKKLVDENGKVIKACDDGACFVYKDDTPLQLSLDGDANTNSACAKLFKASFIKNICFEEGKHVNEDGFFIFQCCVKRPILVQHNVPVYQYNVREGSGSRQSFSDKHLAMLYFCNLKKEMVERSHPQYIEQAYNMEVRTHLQFLDVLCRTDDKKYKDIYKASVEKVRKLYSYHKPINGHYKKLAWIVVHGLYPLYKKAIRFKYYR